MLMTLLCLQLLSLCHLLQVLPLVLLANTWPKRAASQVLPPSPPSGLVPASGMQVFDDTSFTVPDRGLSGGGRVHSGGLQEDKKKS